MTALPTITRWEWKSTHFGFSKHENEHFQALISVFEPLITIECPHILGNFYDLVQASAAKGWQVCMHRV